MIFTFALLSAVVILIGGTAFPHGSQMLRLHPGTARLAGLCFLALFVFRSRTDNVTLIALLGVGGLVLTAISMILGVTLGIHRD